MINLNQKTRCKEDKLQITKDVAQKDIELTLELEMDDEVKEIITCPEKYADTMLDVTVIKPKLDKLYSTQKKVMSGEEVKKFIAAMSSAKSVITPTIPKEKPSNDPTEKRNPMNRFAPPSSNKTEGSTSEIDKDKIKQIYTTPKTFTEINSLFECKNKNRRNQNDKPDNPCLCKNCSIVGVVTDSQKKPFANENMYDPRDNYNPKKETKEDYNKRKKVTNYKDENHVQCQYYFKHLSDKIKVLEARVAAQEEKSVAKDYFKKIITKVMNHITKVTTYASQIRMETVLPCNSKRPKESPRDKYNQFTQKFIVNPLSVDKEKQSDKDGPSTSTGTFWKWGEDILKPGIDLKNKIIVLLEDTLNNLKKSKDRSRDEDIKHFVDEFSAHLYKTVHDGIKEDKKKTKTEFNESDNRNKNNGKMKDFSRTFRRVAEEPVSVTYVNSKILKWKETETTFKFESDKESIKNMHDQKRMQEFYKLEFMKTLKNTKEEDKAKLWCSIWNQAVKNRQEKSDKVTIQIPDRRDPKRKQVEIVYTLGDLEYLLLGQKSRNR